MGEVVQLSIVPKKRIRKARAIATMADRIAALVRQSRYRAKKSGVPHSLDAAWVSAAGQITHCPITGRKLRWDGATYYGAPHPDAASLDQMEPNEGYTPENTRVVSFFANSAKGGQLDNDFVERISLAYHHYAKPAIDARLP